MFVSDEILHDGTTVDEELFKYELNEDFSLETGVVAGELYRRNGEWKFNAVGSGFAGGLSAICRNFGLNL